MDEIKKAEEAFLKDREKMVADNKKIAEMNAKHNKEAKENWVFEHMEKIYEQEARWGGQRGYKE